MWPFFGCAVGSFGCIGVWGKQQNKHSPPYIRKTPQGGCFAVRRRPGPSWSIEVGMGKPVALSRKAATQSAALLRGRGGRVGAEVEG